MSRAFQCDRCNEFEKGNPNRYRVQEYVKRNFGGVEIKDEERMELCSECEDEFNEIIEKFIAGDGEWLEAPHLEENDDETVMTYSTMQDEQ